MTRSVTIVNTSNWDHEDYMIRVRPSQGHVRLKPGESVKLDVYDSCAVQLVPVEYENPVPFERDVIDGEGKRGREIVKPTVSVEFTKFA